MIQRLFRIEANRANRWADHYSGPEVEDVAKSSYHRGRAVAFLQAARMIEFTPWRAICAVLIGFAVGMAIGICIEIF